MAAKHEKQMNEQNDMNMDETSSNQADAKPGGGTDQSQMDGMLGTRSQMVGLQLQANTKGCDCLLPDLAPMSWFSFGVSSALLWLFQRGVLRIRITRHRTEAGVRVEIQSLETGAMPPLRSGSSTPVKLLVGVRLIKRWTAAPSTSILDRGPLPPDATLAQAASDLADTAANFFLKGATELRAQYSRDATQIWINTHLDTEDIRDLASHAPHYEPGDSVSKLPWVE
jgi:hypothetical protein